ncbi:zf-TFIIB domain-containing protein [Paracidovorax valerianellae]|nr:zf-TFIIB domain-containing protein [Paracidovorax valerianellae]
MPMTPHCPSCRQPAETHRFMAHGGSTIELDLCFACQGLWFDPQENTRLAPAGVLALFELLHQHRSDTRHPVAQRLQCPRCPRGLEPGFDVAKGGRYKTFRCPERHGRFSTFGSLMVEKGFVRHLSVAEIEALAERVGTIQCTSCGGTVDIRNDHACPYCRSALSLLDPQAVDRALNRHASAARALPAAAASGPPGPSDVADALVALERVRSQEQRQQEKDRLLGTGDRLDLLAAGLALRP